MGSDANYKMELDPIVSRMNNVRVPSYVYGVCLVQLWQLPE